MLCPYLLVPAALAPLAGAASLVHSGHHHVHSKGQPQRGVEDLACGFTNPLAGSRGLKSVQRLRATDADLVKREKHEPVIVAVNLHAGLPSNATDNYVSEGQLREQFRVLEKECMSNVCPPSHKFD